MKHSYSTGGNCPGKGQGPMGGSKGAYISNMGKKPSGAAQNKPGNEGSKDSRNSPGKGAGRQGTNIVGGRKGYEGHSGMMRMGNND